MRVAYAKDGDSKFRFREKVENKHRRYRNFAACLPAGRPEHAYIRAGLCAGKKTFGSRKAFRSFGLQKNKIN